MKSLKKSDLLRATKHTADGPPIFVKVRIYKDQWGILETKFFAGFAQWRIEKYAWNFVDLKMASDDFIDWDLPAQPRVVPPQQLAVRVPLSPWPVIQPVFKISLDASPHQEAQEAPVHQRTGTTDRGETGIDDSITTPESCLFPRTFELFRFIQMLMANADGENHSKSGHA